MARKIIEYKTGQKINSLTYLSESSDNVKGSRYCNFKCHCGNEFTTLMQSAKYGTTRSCGCLNRGKKGSLSNAQIKNINKMVWEDALPLRVIAQKHNMSISSIYQIKVGKTYKKVV